MTWRDAQLDVDSAFLPESATASHDHPTALSTKVRQVHCDPSVTSVQSRRLYQALGEISESLSKPLKRRLNIFCCLALVCTAWCACQKLIYAGRIDIHALVGALALEDLELAGLSIGHGIS